MASWNWNKDNTSAPVQEQSGSLKVESEFPLADYNQDAVPPALRTDRSGVEGVWDEDDKQENISSFNNEDSNTTWEESCATEAHAVQDDHLPDNNVACMHEVLRNRTDTSNLNSSFDRMSLRSFPSTEKTNSLDYDCPECGILNKAMPSEDSKKFWQSIPEVGLNQDRCHVKLWEHFENKIKEDYPNAVDLLSRQLMAFMKNLLEVNPTSKLATIKYEIYYELVIFFGPMRSDDPVMLRQLQEIVVKSKKERKVGTSEKISWFAGKMKRDEAETRLGKEKDETYLIRMSETERQNASFVISVKSDGVVVHFKIEQDFKAAAGSIPFHAHLSLDGKTFESLVKVVDYLLTNPLKDGEQKIWCRTVCPGLPLNGIIVSYKKLGRR